MLLSAEPLVTPEAVAAAVRLHSDLKGRPKDVLEVICLEGITANRAIGLRLDISWKTVDVHIQTLYQIFDVHDRASLILAVTKCAVAIAAAEPEKLQRSERDEKSA